LQPVGMGERLGWVFLWKSLSFTSEPWPGREHALDQRTLLALGAGRRVTAKLPVIMDGLDSCLCPRMSYSKRRKSNDQDQPSAGKAKRSKAN